MAQPIEKIFLISGAPVQYSRPPAALAFMAGVCERNGVNYHVHDLNIGFIRSKGLSIWNQCYPFSTNNLGQIPKDLGEIVDCYLDSVVEQICAADADCVAISLLSFVQQQWIHRFLQRLRLRSTVMTIAGGPGVGVPYHGYHNAVELFGKVMVDQGLLDYYVMGEGDIVFDQFIQGHRDLPGLNSQDHSNESWQPQIDDLDSLPVPSYRKIDFSLYQSPDETPMISLTGSRGCVRRCTFCDVGHLWKKFRYRNGKNIADEMLKHFRDTGIQNFWFNDSLINGSLKNFTELMQNLIIYKNQHGMDQLRFSGQFIVRNRQSHPERMYQLMSESGCHHIQIGVESGSESVRKHMGKKFTNQDIDHHFEMCEKYKIKNWLLMIVGYPTETYQDFLQTLDLLERYQKYIINDTMLGLNLKSTLIILPDSPLFRMQDELGFYYLHDNPTPESWMSHSNPELTVRERYLRWIKAIKLAIELGYYLPHEILADLANNQRTALELAADHKPSRTTFLIQNRSSILS